MPGFNRQGPLGEGSMTGRRRGPCANKNTQVAQNTLGINKRANQNASSNELLPEQRGMGLGMKKRFGFGRGFRSQW